MIDFTRVFQNGHNNGTQCLEADDREGLVEQVAQLAVPLAALQFADVVDLLDQFVAQTLRKAAGAEALSPEL